MVADAFNPVEDIIKTCRAFNPEIKVLIDGSQGVVHRKVNVTKMDADFYIFTGHKLYGPSGIGVLYGKYDLLESMPPYQGGGDMIETVSFEGTTFNELPYKFEAGTPHIAGAIGLAAAGFDLLIEERDPYAQFLGQGRAGYFILSGVEGRTTFGMAIYGQSGRNHMNQGRRISAN